MKISAQLIALSLSCLFVFNSCQDKDEDLVPVSETQEIVMHCHAKSGAQHIEEGIELSDSTGRKFKFDIFRFYMSNLVLVKGDGSEVKINKYILIKEEEEEINLGKVPVGDYVALKLSIGIDSVTNHSDITAYPASDPLAVQNPSMHWGWNSGYIFMKIEGLVDTTKMATGPVTIPFAYHIGMDQLRTVITKTIDMKGKPATGIREFHFSMKYDQLLKNIDWSKETITHTMGNMALAQKIMANAGKALTLHVE